MCNLQYKVIKLYSIKALLNPYSVLKLKLFGPVQKGGLFYLEEDKELKYVSVTSPHDYCQLNCSCTDSLTHDCVSWIRSVHSQKTGRGADESAGWQAGHGHFPECRDRRKGRGWLTMTFSFFLRSGGQQVGTGACWESVTEVRLAIRLIAKLEIETLTVSC